MNLEDVLDDLCARFIINLPEEERSSFERLGFQIEQAFWFYDDFYRPNNHHLPRLTLRTFGQVFLQRYPPLIAPFGRNFDRLFEEFLAYKHTIPVCGAIILNENLTKCLMVKGWSSKSTWGFPKGKIGKDEDPSDCAVREVFEETGFDISSRLSTNNYIDAHSYAGSSGGGGKGSNSTSQSTRLFIIPNVPESTVFIPQTRKEISKIQWHSVESLPTKYGQNNSFYNVVNFVKKLKQWIRTRGPEYISSKKKGKAAKSTATNSTKIDTKNSPKKNRKKNDGNRAADGEIKTVQDIFEKLRLKNDYSPVNSILMRDNPSPIHLFEKLTFTDQNSTQDAPEVETDPKTLVFNALQSFAVSLRNIRLKRSVIRETVNKCF